MDEASGSRVDWRERKGSDCRAGDGCSKGALARAGHLGERDAAPTPEDRPRAPRSISLFLSPIPPLSHYLTQPILLIYLFAEGT